MHACVLRSIILSYMRKQIMSGIFHKNTGKRNIGENKDKYYMKWTLLKLGHGHKKE
jgi:hypothetical protein